MRIRLLAATVLFGLGVYCGIAGWQRSPLSPMFVWVLLGILCGFVALLLLASGDD